MITKIVRRDSELELVINGKVVTLSGEKIRRACPCANCQELRGSTSHSDPLGIKGKKSMLQVIDATLESSTTITSLQSIGSYAIRIVWSDGHGTGIYPFALLEQLVYERN